jgi:hypothetical protein
MEIENTSVTYPCTKCRSAEHDYKGDKTKEVDKIELITAASGFHIKLMNRSRKTVVKSVSGSDENCSNAY